MKKWISIVVLALLAGCASEPSADLVIINARIYTVNDNLPVVSALAIKDGKIMKLGEKSEVEVLISDSTEVMDLEGQFVFPGFIEGHAHLMGIGANLLNVDLSTAQSYDEVIEMVKKRAMTLPKGDWILGRGWHQDKWLSTSESSFRGFPTHEPLSEAVPDHPVYLSHASGHAALVNDKALAMAGIDKETSSPAGGEIVKNISGNPTGILNEMASDLVFGIIPEASYDTRAKTLSLAIDECLKNGLTGFHDAGAKKQIIDLYKDFAEAEKLKMRLHVMVAGYDTASVSHFLDNGPEVGLYNDHLNVSAIKLYSDGALGSRGAWLLEEYTDAPGIHGHNTTPLDTIASIAEKGYLNGFQICTHAIGDRANREVLDIYESMFEKYPEKRDDRRFRIEHAQHIHPDDISRFAELGVVPAMQAIHMSSDRPWAIDRLGKERIENGAYMWSELIDNGSPIVNGTDAPVEPVNPLASFYASVSRKTLKGTPNGGYEPGQKMTREEALKSYTLWPAYGAFMEDLIGSIEVGKYADFTVLDRDIMTIPEEEILETKVLKTVIAGEVLYSAN
ncbi:MAG: amidohydrolase [Cyclobacteriaceae bacterium]